MRTRLLVADPFLQYTFPVSLANLLSSEIFESRTKRPVNVVILSQKSVLSRVAERVKLIAPMTHEVEEPNWRLWGQIGTLQIISSVVVRV